MSWRRRLLLAYGLLLLVSWGYQALTPASVASDSSLLRTELPNGAYIASRTFGDEASDPVVLLHGSPMAGRSMVALSQSMLALNPDQYILIPDMPGFGDSRQALDDYSFARHADDVLSWLDALRIERAHVVAYSMGGGVALSAYATQAPRFRSLSMVSAIGVQELELLGNYHWNHSVHGVQLAFLQGLDWLLPHFGAFDSGLLNIAYARNFYDSDQRPLREVLKGFVPPMLIVHGEGDSLVPYAAALEHARLVPHSSLVSFVGGHGLVFNQPADVAEVIVNFISSVDSGGASSLEGAQADRLAAAALAFDRRGLPALNGLALILIAGAIILLSYVSEDLACIVAGLLAAAGTITFFEAVVFAFLGIYSGDMLVYLGGMWARRTGGRKVSARLSSARFLRAQQLFTRNRARAVVAARFIPGSRFAIFFTAGLTGMNFALFSLLLVLPALIWTPALTGLAMWGGEQFLMGFAAFQRNALPWVAGLAGGFWLLATLIRLARDADARRLLWGRWQRLRRWEFWPIWALYLPLLPWFLLLSIRYRGATVFTAVNPGIPDGGFIGESKADILQALDHPSVLPQLLVPAQSSLDERQACVQRFMSANSLQLPLVLKPDQGDRGSGVAIVRDTAALNGELEQRRMAFVVQPFIAGEEFGVFYVRHPENESGEIFSVTIKRPVQLIGDGEHTLRQLILADDRAVMMAPTHFERHAANLTHVPDVGEPIELVELGTHSRGCVFMDGAHLRSSALLKKMDEISRKLPGFYFGRYDVKASSADDLRLANGIKILEINGVTSEASSIYDPSNSVWVAWRVLARQWHLAYQIGASNRVRGAAVTPIWQLLRTVVKQDQR